MPTRTTGKSAATGGEHTTDHGKSAADPDADLIRACADGDERAFEEIYRRHRHRLLRAALGMCRNWEDAEEAVQDAMLSAHKGAARFHGDAAVGTWLRSIVDNACRDKWRRHNIRAKAEGEHQAALIEHPAEQGHKLYAALQALNPGQREAVFSVYIAGFSVEEAAQLLDIPPGTIKSRCARGRRALRSELQNGGTGESK